MKLYHRVLGEGKPFIILHGLFGLSDNWQTIAKKLAEDYKIILVDQRNHGQSPHSNEWDYKVMSEDLLELIKDEGFEKPIVMGHSMGGKTAMQFAFDYEEILDKLIVVDIAPKRYKTHQRDIVDALKSIDLSVKPSRKEVDEQLAKLIPDFGTRQFLLKNLYWINDTQLGWRFNLDVIDKNLEIVSHGLSINKKQCNAETLFIRGEKSGYIKDEDFGDIKNLFPNSTINTIDDAGHWVHADKPQELLNSINSFLKS